MVGVRFSRIAEAHSGQLADSLVGKLMESPRTAAYREIDGEALRREIQGFFQSLTDWLLYHGQADIEANYVRLGKRRASQGIPLEESVNAMLACRDHLVEYLRREAGRGTNVELFGELEFVVAVNHFFDDAIFFCMKGHRANEGSGKEVRDVA
jgi:hypothetical protein